MVEVSEADPESEYGGQVVRIRDWKSAWNTDSERLNHWQQRAQAVLAWIHYPEATEILREVTNLRTGVTYSDTLYMADPGTIETLEEWKSDIDSSIKALEDLKSKGVDGRRPAVPGAGCVGCPYLTQCDEGRAYIADAEGIQEHGSVSEKAILYALLVAHLGQARETLVKAGGDPVEIPGGVVGYVRKPKTVLRDGVHREIMEEWFAGRSYDQEGVSSLLASLDLSKTAVEKMLKRLYPDKADIPHRVECLERWTEEVGTKRFMVDKT